MIGDEGAYERIVDDHRWKQMSNDSDNCLVISLQFNQGENNRYKDTNLLIDTGSTCSFMKNVQMLIDVRKSEKTSTHTRMRGIRTQTKKDIFRDSSKLGSTLNPE